MMCFPSHADKCALSISPASTTIDKAREMGKINNFAQLLSVALLGYEEYSSVGLAPRSVSARYAYATARTMPTSLVRDKVRRTST